MDKYIISFDHRNAISIKDKETNRLITCIACPPKDYGCDIISFDEKLIQGYHYDFEGFILITTPDKRELYHKGKIIASINNPHK